MPPPFNSPWVGRLGQRLGQRGNRDRASLPCLIHHLDDEPVCRSVIGIEEQDVVGACGKDAPEALAHGASTAEQIG